MALICTQSLNRLWRRVTTCAAAPSSSPKTAVQKELGTKLITRRGRRHSQAHTSVLPLQYLESSHRLGSRERCCRTPTRRLQDSVIDCQ